jgi:hypothetical protein
MSKTRNNPETMAPNLPYPERGDVVVDRIMAQNPRRRGPLQAEEGLAFEPAYSSSFAGGVSSDLADHATFEVQEAGQANGRGRLASGQEVPTWAVVDVQMKAGFWQGIDLSEQIVTVRPQMPQPRPGGNATIVPLAALVTGERPGTTYGRAVAPPNGGRHRRNSADVTETL